MISDDDKLPILRTYSMDNVGTRLDFLTELYDLWKTALDILERYDKNSPRYDARKLELESATKLLVAHMEICYNENLTRKTVDALPKHGEDIHDDNPNK